MSSIATPLSDAEVDQLSEFLDSLPSPEAMNIEQFDGFFCALVIGPDLVMPSEYWPHIVGSDEDESSPTFASMEQAQTIMGLVTRHWNSIVAKLRADRFYVPIVLVEEDGVALGTDWALGFMQGVELRADSWSVLIEDDDHCDLILPILALAQESDSERKLRRGLPAVEQRTEMLETMTTSIMEMYLYFAPMRAESTTSDQPFVRTERKIGRNELCPCGSGKKYKQCCMTLLR